jgi:hypothetical protein
VKVLVYPADHYGCGHHRLIWPSEVLKRDGHDVTYVPAGDRRVEMGFDEHDVLQWMNMPEGVDVVVFQRITDRRLVQAVPYLRSRGIAVVIDVDDDLSSIHPAHPAFHELNPHRAAHEVTRGVNAGFIKSQDQKDFIQKQLEKKYHHSWHNLDEACRLATLVTASTEGLLRRYAAHGRGRVLLNYAPDHYFDITHVDSGRIGWPATLYSHPNDADPVGNAIARLVAESVNFTSIGDPTGMGRAFGLPADPAGSQVDIQSWPHALAQLGIGIAPLADTQFNACKSWLKPLELSAVGVPWVASPRAEYIKLHALGAGILVNKPKTWYRALHNLVNNSSERAELSLAGREVALRLRLSDHAWRHAEAWSDALVIQRANLHERTIVA